MKQRAAGNASTLLWVTEECPAAVGEVRLAAGDVVVQRGTNHAWINRGNTVCRLGMVFIDADEPAEILAMGK